MQLRWEDEGDTEVPGLLGDGGVALSNTTFSVLLVREVWRLPQPEAHGRAWLRSWPEGDRITWREPALPLLSTLERAHPRHLRPQSLACGPQALPCKSLCVLVLSCLVSYSPPGPAGVLRALADPLSFTSITPPPMGFPLLFSRPFRVT